MCHHKNEEIVKFLLSAIVNACPCLEGDVHIIGVDDENGLSNIGCASFSVVVLLLGSVHAKKNITSKLADLLNEKSNRAIVCSEIFGSDSPADSPEVLYKEQE